MQEREASDPAPVAVPNNETDPFSERRNGPTSRGGAYSVIQYRDARGNPVPKSWAVSADLCEFDAEGRCIHRQRIVDPTNW